jgi:putative endonuclease
MAATERTAQLGRIGEAMAVRHLEGAGLTVVARNWRPARGGGLRGELDIVAWDGPVLVFCEVKARRGSGAGGPLAAVTPTKVRQLRQLGAAFLATSGLHAAEVRFDVVGVCWPDGGGRAEITHLAGV